MNSLFKCVGRENNHDWGIALYFPGEDLYIPGKNSEEDNTKLDKAKDYIEAHYELEAVDDADEQLIIWGDPNELIKFIKNELLENNNDKVL